MEAKPCEHWNVYVLWLKDQFFWGLLGVMSFGSYEMSVSLGLCWIRGWVIAGWSFPIFRNEFKHDRGQGRDLMKTNQVTSLCTLVCDPGTEGWWATLTLNNFICKDLNIWGSFRTVWAMHRGAWLASWGNLFIFFGKMEFEPMAWCILSMWFVTEPHPQALLEFFCSYTSQNLL